MKVATAQESVWGPLFVIWRWVVGLALVDFAVASQIRYNRKMTATALNVASKC